MIQSRPSPHTQQLADRVQFFLNIFGKMMTGAPLKLTPSRPTRLVTGYVRTGHHLARPSAFQPVTQPKESMIFLNEG